MYLKTKVVFYGYGNLAALTNHLEYLGLAQEDLHTGELAFFNSDISVKIEYAHEVGEYLGDYLNITIESREATFDHPKKSYQSVANFAAGISQFLINTPAVRSKK